ncbi:DNA-binding protein [Denitratimonas sp. CY0512]|uniref:DNA-binding protein n=1 Tax=Denitratimonas sp. CY0512 TaxID=3131940 RepID=UPI0030A9DD9B
MSSLMFDRYGPLVTLAQLAKILNRSTDGVRMALRESTPYALRLNQAKVRIGRRIYFRTTDVVEVIVTGDRQQD